jgi:hypothetical protein
MVTAERIRGRQVSVEIGEVPGVGWAAVGIVKEGLSHEKGMRVVKPRKPEARRRRCLPTSC